MLRQRAQLLLSRTLSVALPAQTQTSSSYHAVSTMSTSESSSSSFWNTTTALIAVTFATTVVATSDYVSPNKITDCCGIIDVIGTNFKEYNNYNGDNCTEKGAFSSSVVADTATATTISASYSSSHRGTATSVTFNNNNNSGRNETSLNFIEHSPPPQQQARSLPGIANDASPRIVDVVFGNIHPNHPGNVVYERLINSFRQRYIISRDALVKETISESIVRAIQGKGGRFLEFIISDQSMTNSSEGFIDGRPGGKWYAIGDSQAVSRTARDLSNRNNNPNLFATASAFDQQSYPLSSTTSTLSSAFTLSSSSTLSSALTLPPPEQAAAPVTRPTNNRVAAFHLDDSSNGSGSGSSNGSGSHRASATTANASNALIAPAPLPLSSVAPLSSIATNVLPVQLCTPSCSTTYNPPPTPTVLPPTNYLPYTGQASKLIPNFGTTPNAAATHDYVSPNKTTDCCGGIVDVHPYPHPPYQHPPYQDDDVNWDVLPDQIFSSTSEAMWMLAPPSSSVLKEEFASSSIAEEFGLGDQELPMEFLIDKFRKKLEVLPDSNISASTMNVRTTTQKRKRPSKWDFTGGEYVEPSDDCQDYSKSDGLVYSKDPNANGLKLDNEPLDKEKVKEGRWYVHATPAANLFDPTITNLEHHSFDLEGGIMGQGLQPMVQTGKKSKKPIEGVWALPGGRVMASIAHIVRTHAEALKKSGGKIALIMIYADDDRINKFTRMYGSTWAQTCHPAYSREEIPVYPKDVLIVDIKKLPVFLKEIKVRTDLIPLKTDAEKKATRDLCFHQWYHHGGGKENGAARYAASTNRPVKRHTLTRGARCTDATLGPNGVLQCRFDTIAHSHSKKKGVDRPYCALHKWAGTRKRSGIVHCETCNVHLCTDCFTTFHTHFDLVAVKKQLNPS